MQDKKKRVSIKFEYASIIRFTIHIKRLFCVLKETKVISFFTAISCITITIIKETSKPTLILLVSCICPSCGVVFVTTTASKADCLILVKAGPLNIPWVKIANTLVAPAKSNLEIKQG